MSELHSGARHVDPLDALRAADHRPIHQVWRERLITRVRHGAASVGFRPLITLVVGVLVAGIVWQLFLATAPPVEDTIPFAQPATDAQTAVETTVVAAMPAVSAGSEPAPLVVHVAGAVHDPGLVHGREGWRIDDAVRAAGGALAAADLDRLNLAALLNDGERVYVPELGESEPSVVAPTGGSTSVGEAAGAGAAPAIVNVNTASAAELETLPGVGPATAATIIAHREEHGNFADVDALVAVRGIGPATLETLRDHVRTS